MTTNCVEMESVKIGSFDNAIFTVTNGVFLIPAGDTFKGDKVLPVRQEYGGQYSDPTIGARVNSGIRGVFSVDTKFAYKDYWINPKPGGTEYDIDSYTTNVTGTTVTLKDRTVNGNVQCFYAYFNGVYLGDGDPYRSYPRNTKSIITPKADYQISCAIDADQWLVDAFSKLGVALNDSSYTTKANDLLAELLFLQTVDSEDRWLFDGRTRGFVWWSWSEYDESGARTISYEQIDKETIRVSVTGDALKRAWSWAIGTPFSWLTNTINLRIAGTNSGELRQLVVKDTNYEYIHTILDNFTSKTDFLAEKKNFTTIDNVLLEASRVPYVDPYSVVGSGSSVTINRFDTTYKDYEDPSGIKYSVWDKIIFSHSGAGSWCIFGSGLPDTTESSPNGYLGLFLSSDISRNITLKVIDANNNEYSKVITVGDSPSDHVLQWSEFGPVAHPINGIQMVFNTSDSGTLYIGSIRVNDRITVVTQNASEFTTFKIEGRDANDNHYDIVSLRLPDGNTDQFKGGCVSLFSREYSEIGILGWRGLSYIGYQYPSIYMNSPNFSESLRFFQESQNAYYNEFGTLGPFYPVFIRNLPENLVWGTPGTWIYTGDDSNTHWGGFQYRAFNALCEVYFKKYKQDITRWSESNWEESYNPEFYEGDEDYLRVKSATTNFVNFLKMFIRKNGGLPSHFLKTGVQEYRYDSVDFIGLVGRACIYKYLTDGDVDAKNIVYWCLNKVLATQDANGAFHGEGELIYGFQQAEVLRFLGALKLAYTVNNRIYKDVNALWKSAWIHFGQPNKYKSMEKVYIHYPNGKSQDFNFGFALNFDKNNIKKLKKLTSIAGQRSRQKELYVSGVQEVKAVQLVIEADEDQDFTISGLTLEEVEIDD